MKQSITFKDIHEKRSKSEKVELVDLELRLQYCQRNPPILCYMQIMSVNTAGSTFF